MAKKAAAQAADEAVKGATSGDLAQLFDCTPRQVELLAKKGIVVRIGRGRYNAAQSTRNYIRHLREQAGGRVGNDPKVDGVAANVKYKDVQTSLAQLRYQQAAGELIQVSDAREAWGRIIRQIRQFVLGLPGQIAFEVPTLTAHDRSTIERLCREGLEDASLARGYRVASGSSDDVSDQ